MTDLTSQTPMRDRKKQSKGEYYAYIAMRKPTEGPIRMAWAQASTVTPKIFWA